LRADAAGNDTPLVLAAITIGELRRGVELIRHRGDQPQAAVLEQWLAQVLLDDGDRGWRWMAKRLSCGAVAVPDPHHTIDKQIAAIALLHDLTVVTRNTGDFARTGVRLLNPFSGG
jgi:predicted nucleic acid-binding protein